MPNKHYVAGRKKEWKVQEDLEKKSYLTFRTAGSHTPVDVLALYKYGPRALEAQAGTSTGRVWAYFVQVKSASPISNSEWNTLYTTAVSCGGIPILAICLPRRPIQYMQLLGTRRPREQKKQWVEWMA